MADIKTTKDALKKGFELNYEKDYGQEGCWECLESGGQYGFNRT